MQSYSASLSFFVASEVLMVDSLYHGVDVRHENLDELKLVLLVVYVEDADGFTTGGFSQNVTLSFLTIPCRHMIFLEQC